MNTIQMTSWYIVEQAQAVTDKVTDQANKVIDLLQAIADKSALAYGNQPVKVSDEIIAEYYAIADVMVNLK